MKPTSEFDSQLVKWASRTPLVRRLWRYESSARPEDWPWDKVEIAVEIDRKPPDESSFVTWFFDHTDFKISLLNSMTADFVISHYIVSAVGVVEDVQATGVLLYARKS
jgi:hypothetical protein